VSWVVRFFRWDESMTLFLGNLFLLVFTIGCLIGLLDTFSQTIPLYLSRDFLVFGLYSDCPWEIFKKTIS